MSDDPQGTSFTDVHLESLRSCYTATRNPLFAFSAIHWCLNEPPQRLPPNWCMDYIAEVARQFELMAATKSPVEIIDGVMLIGSIGKKTRHKLPTASEIARAIGFTSKGRNAFKDAASQMRSVRAFILFRRLRKTGSSYSKALKEVTDWLGLSEGDEANVKKIISAGKRSLGGKTSR